jgi:hypothetical protein
VSRWDSMYSARGGRPGSSRSLDSLGSWIAAARASEDTCIYLMAVTASAHAPSRMYLNSWYISLYLHVIHTVGVVAKGVRKEDAAPVAVKRFVDLFKYERDIVQTYRELHILG